MEARAVLDDVRKRLMVMAERPPFRFLDTSERDAEAYLQQMKTFLGYKEEEIAQVEQRLGIAFSTVFREFLLLMGRRHGELFVGSVVANIDNIEELREYAIDLMSESGVEEPLPSNAVVFLFHQGYQFEYLIADGAFDSAVYHYSEGDRAPSVVAPSFAVFLDGVLQFSEQSHLGSHEFGGYYLTVDGENITRTYPARSSGDRPLENPG